MFCDYYSPQSGTYCKRLKVLCPEHTKEPKVSSDQKAIAKNRYTASNEVGDVYTPKGGRGWLVLTTWCDTAGWP